MIASTNYSYNGCDFHDGQLRMHFSPNYLGTNIDQTTQDIAKAISAAPQPAGASTLSYTARHSVKTDYDPKIGTLLEKAQKALENPKLKFEPDFEGLGKMLKGGKDVRDDWETNIGDFTMKYYESFVDALDREKFASDDMLREGFEEAVPSGVIKMRIVEKMDGYNGLKLEDGALYLQASYSEYVDIRIYTDLYRLHPATSVQTSTTRRRNW